MKSNQTNKFESLETTEYQLNCFSLSTITFSSISSTEQSLILAGNGTHIYKFSLLKDKPKPQNSLEISIQMDDLSSNSILDILESNGSQISPTLNMDTGMRVKKCLMENISINEERYQVVIIAGIQGDMKILLKSVIGQSYSQYRIIDSPILGNRKSLDFRLVDKQSSGHKRLQILSLDFITQTLYFQRFMISKQNQMQKPTFIIEKQVELNSDGCYDWPNLSFSINGKFFIHHNSLRGIYEPIVYDIHSQSQIQYHCFSNLYLYCVTKETIIVRYEYGTGKQHFKKLEGTIRGISFLQQRLFVVSLSNDQSRISIFSQELTQLVYFQIHQISKLELISFPQNLTQLSSIYLFDEINLKVHKIKSNSLLKQHLQCIDIIQQQKIHQSTLSTLNYRLKLLKTLKNYIDSKDYNSALRYLNSCTVQSIVSDGIKLLRSSLSREKDLIDTLLMEYQLLKVTNNLLMSSKYESHIQNSLQILLQNLKIIKQNGLTMNSSQRREEVKIWKDYVELFHGILQSKKIKKLMQQEKSKKIFQLTYQLVHTANSSIFFNHSNPF